MHVIPCVSVQTVYITLSAFKQFPKMIEKLSKLCKHACSYIEYMLNCKVTTCSYFSWILNNSYVIVKLNKEEG